MRQVRQIFSQCFGYMSSTISSREKVSEKHTSTGSRKISQKSATNKNKTKSNIPVDKKSIKGNNYKSTSAERVTSRNHILYENEDIGKTNRRHVVRNQCNKSIVLKPGMHGKSSVNQSENSPKYGISSNASNIVNITDRRQISVVDIHPTQASCDHKREITNKGCRISDGSSTHSQKSVKSSQRPKDKDFESGIEIQKSLHQYNQRSPKRHDSKIHYNRPLEICNIGEDGDVQEQKNEAQTDFSYHHNNPNKSEYINNEDHTSSNKKNVHENDDQCGSKDRNGGSISSESDDLYSRVGAKIGFDNPEGFCFLNAVVQLLRGCLHFNKALLKYHHDSKMVDSLANENQIIFVIKFCKMMNDLKMGNDIHIELQHVQNYFSSSRGGDDVNKFFMNLLTILNTVSRNPRSRVDRTTISSNDPHGRFKACRDANHGFVFDNFYGQMSHTITCEGCDQTLHTSYQLFNSLPLPVPKSTRRITLERCFEMFFGSSKVEINGSLSCECQSPRKSCISTPQITHSPRYLFIYLNRGSFVINGKKNNTFITCKRSISIQTLQGPVDYYLISVIDHIGTNEGGHYYCKCNYETEDWWLLNDIQVSHMGTASMKDIITKNTIVFMFKKGKCKL